MSAVSETGTRAARIDWRQVRALVRAFAVMSFRTLPVRTMRGEKSSGSARGLWIILVLYLFLGLAFAAVALALKEVIVFSFLIHTFTLFVVGSSALNEASEVLFNTSENDILLHRPIGPATLVIAKGLTIILFTLLLGGAINLFPTFAMLRIDDANVFSPLVHVVSVVVSAVFASGAVICLYGVISRVLGRERFQKVITVVQIASTLFLAVGFQIIPRLLDPERGFDLGSFVHSSPFAWAFPSLWFAALDAWLGSHAQESVYAGLALCGLGVTLGCAWLGAVRLPAAGNHVANVSEEARKDIPPAAQVAGGQGLVERVLAPWLRHPLERASFALAKAHLVRERQVKVRLAAALAYIVMLPILSIVSANGQFLALMSFWMTAMVSLTVLELLRIGSQPAAADLFAYSPIAEPERVFHGVRKAAIVFIQLPMFVYVTIIGFIALRATPGLLLSAIPALFVLSPMSLVAGIAGEYVPFSAATRTGERTLRSFIVLIAMIPAGVLGTLSYFAYRYGYLGWVIALTAVLAVVAHVGLSKLVVWRARQPNRRRDGAAPGWGSGKAAAS